MEQDSVKLSKYFSRTGWGAGWSRDCVQFFRATDRNLLILTENTDFLFEMLDFVTALDHPDAQHGQQIMGRIRMI